MPTLDIVIGNHPVAIRHRVLKAEDFLGDTPELSSAALVPNKYTKGIFTFGAPTDEVQLAGDKGGAHQVNQGIGAAVDEIHLECGAGSVVDITITDPDGSHPRLILKDGGGTITHFFSPPPAILPGQIIKVEETTGGTTGTGIDKYVTFYLMIERTL